MPKIHTVINLNDTTSPDSQPSVPGPGRPTSGHSDPLAWKLGGAPPARRQPGPPDHDRRREQSSQRPHAAVDARRRRSPSSRFRG